MSGAVVADAVFQLSDGPVISSFEPVSDTRTHPSSPRLVERTSGWEALWARDRYGGTTAAPLPRLPPRQ